MLPFSKIACVQCRHFAIRSFASAAAASAPSASTSSSNPASTPLPSVKAGQQLAGSSKHASNPAQRSSKSPSYSRSRRRRRSSAGQSVLRSKQPSPTVTDLLPKQQELEQEHRQSPEAAEATKAVLKSIQDHKARAEKAASKVGGSGSRKKRPKKRAAPKIVHKRISRKTFMPVVSLRTAHEDRANRKGKSKTADRSQDKVAEKTEPTIRTRDREDAGVRPTNASSKVSDKQQNDIANVSGFTTRDCKCTFCHQINVPSSPIPNSLCSPYPKFRIWLHNIGPDDSSPFCQDEIWFHH